MGSGDLQQALKIWCPIERCSEGIIHIINTETTEVEGEDIDKMYLEDT